MSTPGLIVELDTSESQSSARLVYTVKEAAVELRIGYSTAREHIRQGNLRSFKIGGRRLIAGEDLVDFIRDLQAQGDGFDV